MGEENKDNLTTDAAELIETDTADTEGDIIKSEESETPDVSDVSDVSIAPETTQALTQPVAQQVPTDSSSPEPAEPTELAKPNEPTEPAEPDKKLRVIIVIGAIIIALALIIGGIVLVNFMDENSLKSQISEMLADDPAVSELTLPGQFSDETDFVVDGVQFDGFTHAPFSDKASANVLAVLKNECIQGYNRYNLSLVKTDGAWRFDNVELKSADYSAFAPISDEALLSHIAEITSEVDKMNSENDGWPVSISSFFGDVPTAEITSNVLNGGIDNIDILISTARDDQEYTGNLILNLVWQDLPDSSPQWTLVESYATADTYGAIGSVPHEGVSPYATQAQQQEYANQKVAWDEFYTIYMTDIAALSDSNYAWIGFTNIPNNTVDMEYTLTLDETGEVLYQSPRIGPNTTIDTAHLSRKLDAGKHSATVTLYLYEKGTNTPTELNSKMTEPVTISVSSGGLF